MIQEMDAAFRFNDWTIRVAPQEQGGWKAEATRWTNADWATGQSPADALTSLAKKMGFDARDLEAAWMTKSSLN